MKWSTALLLLLLAACSVTEPLAIESFRYPGPQGEGNFIEVTLSRELAPGECYEIILSIETRAGQSIYIGGSAFKPLLCGGEGVGRTFRKDIYSFSTAHDPTGVMDQVRQQVTPDNVKRMLLYLTGHGLHLDKTITF